MYRINGIVTSTIESRVTHLLCVLFSSSFLPLRLQNGSYIPTPITVYTTNSVKWTSLNANDNLACYNSSLNCNLQEN